MVSLEGGAKRVAARQHKSHNPEAGSSGVWPCAVGYGLALPSPMAPALPAACLTLSKVAMWVPIVGLGAVAWQVATAAARVCDSDAALPTSREDRRLRC